MNKDNIVTNDVPLNPPPPPPPRIINDDKSVDTRHNVTIFYDRKHNCEVTSDQLRSIKYIVSLVTTEDNDDLEITTLLEACDNRFCELGYRSSECGDFNWDRWLNYTDLVFLRIEWGK